MTEFQKKTAAARLGAFSSVVRFLSDLRNAERVSEVRPVARQIVLYLARAGGVSDLSEMALARVLARAPSAIAANLAWLEHEGALVVERRSVGGLRQASVRRLDVRGCLGLFARVLGRVASSVSSLLRRLRARRKVRAFRALPAERGYTPEPLAEPFRRGKSFPSEVAPDAAQMLARHGRGEIYLEPATLRALVAQVAGELGMTVREVSVAFRVPV